MGVDYAAELKTIQKKSAGLYVTTDGRYAIEHVGRNWLFGPYDPDAPDAYWYGHIKSAGWYTSESTLREAMRELARTLRYQTQSREALDELQLQPGDLVAIQRYWNARLTFGEFVEEVSGRRETPSVKLIIQKGSRHYERTADFEAHYIVAVRAEAEAAKVKQVAEDANERQQEADEKAREVLGPSADADILQALRACFAAKDRGEAMDSLFNYAYNRTHVTEVES